MSQAERQYCKIFINGSLAYDKLIAVIARAAQGRVEGRYVYGKSSELDVMQNSDYDPKKMEKRDDPDHFLFFPIFLDVEPRSGSTRDRYVGELKAIVSELRRNGCSVVPACSFEEEFDEK